MVKRNNLSKKTRIEVFGRAGGICQNCNQVMEDNLFHVHHKVEVRKGGTNKIDNLIAVCIPCHKRITGESARADPFKKRMNEYDDKEQVIGAGSDIIMASNKSGDGGRSWFAF